MKHSPDKTYKLLETDHDDDNDDDDDDDDDNDVMMIMINSSDYLNVFCNYGQIKTIFCQSNFQPKVCNSYLIQCQAICNTSQ